MPDCCCNISAHLDTCTSVEAQVERWAMNNGCSNSSASDISFQIPGEITCYTYDSCQANTTYCIYEHRGHFDLSTLPTGQIADFFANHMCTTGNPDAIWDASQRICRCPQTPQELPTYCSTIIETRRDYPGNRTMGRRK